MAPITAVSSRLHPIIQQSRRRIRRPSSLKQSSLRPSIRASDLCPNFSSNDDDGTSSSCYQPTANSCRSYTTLNTPYNSQNNPTNQPQTHPNQSIRNFTLPTLACAEYTPTLYGLTPFLLTSFHSLGIPYYGGIALTNILVRSSMIPLVIRGAKTSLGIGVVAPEVQYLITNFRNDFGMLKKKEGQSGGNEAYRKAQLSLVRYTVESLRGIFRLHKVNLLDVFKSPLLQIPIFWYFALDLRQVINGADPILAQALVDTTFLHITDLTEPDPYYALPIVTGALLYFNVETAVGKKALSGETSSQSKLALAMKDFFQSLAIFMPCFMVQQPSGVQIYLMTSMIFSLCQSVAMRNDSVREAVGLPPMYQKPKGMEEGKFVKEFMEMMRERQEAKARGEFILGEGVLKLGGMPAQTGRRRKSTIEVVKSEEDVIKESVGGSKVQAVEIELPLYTLTSLLINPDQFATRPAPIAAPPMRNMPTPSFASDKSLQTMPDISMETMERANRGEKPVQIEMAPKELLEQNKKVDAPIDLNKFMKKRGKQKGKGRKGR